MFHIGIEKKFNFGFKDLNEEDLGQIQIFEEYTYKVNYETKIGKYLENYVELKNDVSYYVNLTFTQYPTSKKIIFYFAQTNYSNLIFHSEIGMLEFDEFPVLRITNILLNMTTRKEGFKMLIEYDWVYSKENSISVYGYHTDDLNVVQSTPGEEL